MRIIGFVALLLAFSYSSIGQTESYVGVWMEYGETDTARAFSIKHDNRDACIELLKSEWGIPANATTGNVLWKEVEIEGFEQSLNITLQDGAFILFEKGAQYLPYKNEKSKKKSLEKGEARTTVIRFNDEDGVNIVRSKELEKQLTEMLNELFGGV